MVKAVFIDIDGTLIQSDHRVSQSTIDIIRKLKEKNILISLVSARPIHGMLAIAEAVGLSSNPIVSLNGANIAINNKIVFESTIDASQIIKIRNSLKPFGSTVIYYERDNWYAEEQNHYTLHEQEITSIPISIQPFAKTQEYWQLQNIGPNKILVISAAAEIRKIENNLIQLFKDKLNISTSKTEYLEIMDISASKLNAIKFLIDRYQIQREDTLAIGDNFNDMDMIAFAGIGVAMGNAPNEVKAVADYVTMTNDDNGVAKALMKFIVV